MGIVKKLFGKKGKTHSELKAEVLKKATDNWNASIEFEDTQKSVTKKPNPVQEDIDQAKKKNIRAVLLEIANGGDAGILPRSISDKTGISTVDTSAALIFLTDNNYAELVNSPRGAKYYLTQTGRKFCASKKFNSEF